MAIETSPEPEFLDTARGEMAFLKAVANARPAGAHRFFHMLTVQNSIKDDTAEEVPIERLWTKLEEFYDLEYFGSNVRVISCRSSRSSFIAPP